MKVSVNTDDLNGRRSVTPASQMDLKLKSRQRRYHTVWIYLFHGPSHKNYTHSFCIHRELNFYNGCNEQRNYFTLLFFPTNPFLTDCTCLSLRYFRTSTEHISTICFVCFPSFSSSHSSFPESNFRFQAAFSQHCLLSKRLFQDRCPVAN